MPLVARQRGGRSATTGDDTLALVIAYLQHSDRIQRIVFVPDSGDLLQAPVITSVQHTYTGPAPTARALTAA